MARVQVRLAAAVALIEVGGMVSRRPVLLPHPTMNDDELLDEFTRVAKTADAIVIEVAMIDWDGPHTPVTTWHAAFRLDAAAPDEAIASARRNVLSNRKFFRVCQRCRTRQPIGWMGSGRSCHACMSRHDGVVF